MAKGKGKPDTKAKPDARPDKAKKKPSRAKTGGQIFVWLMLGMVVFGLGGYGVTNFGGSVNSIGSVGGQDISTQQYYRALQRELNSYRQRFGNSLTAQQAKQLGMNDLVRQQLITTAALDNEDRRIGVSVGNGPLRDNIAGIPAFQGPNGKFDKSTYAFALQQSGLSEREFEAEVRRDMARGLLQQAVGAPVPAPKAYVDTLVNYLGQKRGFTLLAITPKDLPAPVPAPDKAALEAYYKAHKAAFTAPEAKMLTYVLLTPEIAAKTVKIDDKTLRKLYDQNKAKYVQPEKRSLDRLVFPTMKAAQDARAKLDAGTSFADLVKARGLKLDQIAMKDASAADLGTAAAKAVFAPGVKAGDVVGPVNSDLGPALFRVTTITPGQTTSFEQAKNQLAQGLKLDKARQAISDQVQSIDDKLASGDTLEQLAKSTGMQLGTMAFTKGDTAGPAADPAFAAAAQKVTAQDYPALIQLKNGGIAALRLDKIRKAALIPFAKVEAKVKAAWTRDATVKALKARADEIVAGMKGGRTMAGFGKPESIKPMTRSDNAPGTPPAVVKAAFAIPAKGDLTVVADGESAYVVQLDSVAQPDPKAPQVIQITDALKTRAAQGFGNDAFALFATAIIDKTPVKLDQQAIASVDSQFR